MLNLRTMTWATLIGTDTVSAGNLNVEVHKGVVRVLDAIGVLPGHRTAGQTPDDATISLP